MQHKLFQATSFFNYWLNAVGEHSLHSPFLFDFYTNIVKKRNQNQFISLAQIRKQLQQDRRSIEVNDLGGGSKHFKNAKRNIADIASSSVTPEKFSYLYARIIQYYKLVHIIELGTSLGINTLYLAKAHDAAQITTFEGSSAISTVAEDLFKSTKSANINLIEGNIDTTLPDHLASIDTIDFALIDANHRLEPTLRYFELLAKKIHHRSIIVVDDIYYSPEMKKAWSAIREHQRVFTTLDFFRCGIILFNPDLSKQNVVLHF